MALIVSFSSVNARAITADGYGKTNKLSQEDALGSLARMIFVQIESDSTVYQSDNGENYFNSTTHSSSDLPMIGVEFRCGESSVGIKCSANMVTERALPLYQQKLKELRIDINDQLGNLQSIPTERHYDYLSDLLASYEQYDKYYTVITFISGKVENLQVPSLSKQEVKNKLIALQARVQSLNLAAKLLTKNIKQKNIFVRPATTLDSREITPFSSSLLNNIKEQFNTVSDPKLAEYYFSGTYQIHLKGVQVSYSLVDKSGQSVKTNVVELAPESYQNFRVKPIYTDFDSLLHKGYAVSSDFKVELNTNIGSRQLLFNGGDTVEILVKVNRAGYFYLVGHSKNSELEHSYLIDVNEGAGNRKFVQYTNADNVNKWVSLGEFEAVAPFGIESLQVIAGEDDLVDRVPSYQFDPESEYYVVSKDIKQGVVKTRALKKKKTKSTNKSIKTAEAVLMFTTQQ